MSSIGDSIATFIDVAMNWEAYASQQDRDPVEQLLDLPPSEELDRAVVGFLRDERWQLQRAAMDLLARRSIPERWMP